jgi:DHA2 family multidrug resistance protein
MMLDRGENLDWFSSTEVVTEAVVSGLAFYLFLVHMFTAKKPFIEPGMFVDRNFAIGLLLIFIVGVILLGTLSLMTPYLQNLMDYPVLTAGLVLAPRGIGTMAAMMMVGRLITRIDARWLIALGISLLTLSLYEMAGYTPDVSQANLVIVGIIQGLGLGFVFVPLSTVTFATLAPQFRVQGTSLFSLMRNIGSSIGISLMIFLLSHNGQILHAELGAHITPFNDLLRQPGIASAWNLSTAAGRAALDAEINRQGAIIAYANDFRLMMYLVLVTLPLVALLRRSGAPSGGHAAAAALD